jgi:hypothetical protein
MKHVLIYESIFEFLDKLTDEQVGKLFRGINKWRLGEEVIFDDLVLTAFWFGVLPNLNKLKDTYDNRVNTSKINGKKGGRPKKQETPPQQSETELLDEDEIIDRYLSNKLNNNN